MPESDAHIAATLVTLQSAAGRPALSTDADGVYHVENVESLVSRIDAVISKVKNADLTEDDRASVRETRKFTNDFIKIVDRSVIDERARVFDPVNAERKMITDRMQLLKSILSDKLDAFDHRVREEKRHAMISHFNDELLMSDSSEVLDGVTFEMVENQSWFNRSASNVKSRESLSARLASIVTLRNIGGDSMTVERAVATLTEKDWDIAQALAQVSEQLRVEKEQEERRRKLEEQHKREIEEAERRGREQAMQESASNKQQENDARTSAPQNVDHNEADNANLNDKITARKFTITVKGTSKDVENVADVVKNTSAVIDKMLTNGDLSSHASVTFE